MTTTLVFPQLADVYAVLSPWADALLRITVALCLVPHGLRTYFGMFPNTGMPINSLPMPDLRAGYHNHRADRRPDAGARSVHAPSRRAGLHPACALGL